jgi:predicted membrane channel-forming protein YqfA (hemolysin III family)
MLDIQRYRGTAYRDEVVFARQVLITHLILGAIIIALFLLHELFMWFALSLAWYLVSLYAMLGYLNERPWCRWVLAGLFVLLAVTGVYFANQVFPALKAHEAPIIPHNLIPIWIGMANLAYATGAMVVLFSSKMRRAADAGFTLW